MDGEAPAGATEPDGYEQRWRTRIAEALRRLHICRGTNGDTIRELLPVIERRIGMQRGDIPEVDTETYPNAAWGTMGECVVRGYSDREIVLAAPTSEPSTDDHDLNGLALLTVLCEWLASAPRRFTYRALFTPAALSVRSSLRLREVNLSKVDGGIAIYRLAGAAPLTYRRSRSQLTLIDRVIEKTLEQPDTNHAVALTHGPHEHTDPATGLGGYFSSLSRCGGGMPAPRATTDDGCNRGLARAFAFCRDWIENLEHGGQVWINLSPYGEPCLGKRGLYHVRDPRVGPDQSHMALLWVLNLSDGDHSLLDIAERSGLPLPLLAQSAERLHQGGLLREASLTGDCTASRSAG